MAIALAAGLSLALAACGGSGKPAASPSAASKKPTTPTAAASPAPVGAQPSSGPVAIASVKADWTAFFDPSTPIAQRVALLQNGARFTPYLRVQAQPGVAHLTTEQVTSVQFAGKAAFVTYNILVNGQSSPALEGQQGMAVLSDGTWLVSQAGFCALLTLENKGKTLPGC